MQEFILKNICLLVFVLPYSLFSTDKDYQITNMDTLNQLSSNVSGNWDVTVEKINVSQFYQNWKEGNIENISWKTRLIPGNLSDLFTNPFPDGAIIYLKKEFFLPKDWNERQFSLYIERVSDRDRTYLNGVLIGSTGEFGSKNPEALLKSRIYDIPESLFNKGEKNLLIIEIEPYYSNQIGLLGNEIKLGPSSMIYPSFHIKEGVKVFISIIYFSIGIIFIYIYIFRRDKKQYLFYALFNIFFSIYQFSISQTIYDYISSKILIWHLAFLLLPPVFSFFSHFIRLYFNKPYSLLLKILDIILLFIFINIIYMNDLKINIFIWRNIHLPIVFIYIIFSIYILINKYIEKNQDSKYMLISFILLLPAVATDILSNLGYFFLPLMNSPIFILSFDVSLAIILSIHIEKIRQDVKDLNVNLEEKVNQRTIELKNSLEYIKNLKLKEDNLHYFIGNKLKNSVDQIEELTQILLQLEFIENEERILVLKKMYDESNELFLTLQKLISWTLIQKNQEFGEVSVFSISETLTKEFNFYKDLALRKDLELKIEFEESSIKTNKEKLIFIIRELLSNSLNSSEKQEIIYLKISENGNLINFNLSYKESNHKDKEESAKNLEWVGGELGDQNISLGISISKIYVNSLSGKFEILYDIDSRTHINFSIPLKA